MKKTIETALRSVLKGEQVAALKEEIYGGVIKVNGIMDSNQKIKAKKEFVVSVLSRIDDLIENSEKSPVFFRAFYSAAKNSINDFIKPILEDMVNQDDINDLDDIPDVEEEKKPESKPKKKPVKKVTPQKSVQKKLVAKKPIKKTEKKAAPKTAPPKRTTTGKTKKAE